jgi:cbb3-type cytochrome oxidase cytochrome c subunit
MIQTLEAEVDERGTVRLAHPVSFDRKHRVLVMVIGDDAAKTEEDTETGWNRPYIDQPYRYLPSAS